MALTVSSAASRRSVDRSKSTIQSSEPGKLRIISDASRAEHSCSLSFPQATIARHRVFRVAKGVATSYGLICLRVEGVSQQPKAFARPPTRLLPGGGDRVILALAPFGARTRRWLR